MGYRTFLREPRRGSPETLSTTSPLIQISLPFFSHAPSLDILFLSLLTLTYPEAIYCACRLFGTTSSYLTPESFVIGHTMTVLCFFIFFLFILPPFLFDPILRKAFLARMLAFQRMFAPLVAGTMLDPAVSIQDHTVNVTQAKFPRSVWEHALCEYLRGRCEEPSRIGAMVHNTVLFNYKFIVLIIISVVIHGIIQRHANPAKKCEMHMINLSACLRVVCWAPPSGIGRVSPVAGTGRRELGAMHVL